MPRLPVLLLGLILSWLSACAHVGVHSDAQVAFDHGLHLFQHGQYAEAIPLLQEATQLNPQFGQAYLYLGRSYLNLGQWGNAIRVLRTAFRLAPEASQHESTQLLLDALLGGAIAALKTGGFREAVGLLHEALGLAPHGQHLLPPLVEALIGWGGQLLAQGQLRDAIGAFREATHLVLSSGPAIFEVKSITEANEREQIRHALSQLYEYRFLHSLPEATLWIVCSQELSSQWYVDYLTGDRGVHLVWLQNDELRGPSVEALR